MANLWQPIPNAEGVKNANAVFGEYSASWIFCYIDILFQDNRLIHPQSLFSIIKQSVGAVRTLTPC